jgi:IS605 OrfB family transposase
VDGRRVSANDRQVPCARQAAAARAWAAIERFYTNCREKRLGRKGYPRFQRDCRSVEDKQTGWQLEPDGKRLTLTDGGGIGRVRLISSHDLIALEDLKVRNLVRNRRLAKAISDVGWARLRWWVEYYGQLQGVLVVAAPPESTSQDCSGVLPDGSPCPARIRKSLSVRTHRCPRCGLLLDRDHNAALMILQHGLALARGNGRWPQQAGEPTEPTELSGTMGHTET